MLLSDMGADVVRVEREKYEAASSDGFILRGRRTLRLNLKEAIGYRTATALAARADVLIEGFRPGVMEKLGLGPEALLSANPRLVYGRMTGWGQYGPYAKAAGHDINYIALSGALHAIGSSDKPVPPLNLVGDFGGGALYLAVGVLAALLHVRAGGRGQVIDAAITDGTASIMSMIYALQSARQWSDGRCSNLLDGGAPYYDTYACADGLWISIGALEPQFYELLLERTGLSKALFASREPASWPALRQALTQRFASKTRAEWCEIFEGIDACFAPVLSMSEAPLHPHNLARGTFVDIGGVSQPAPAPRFSQTPASIQAPPHGPETDAERILDEWQ